MIPPTTAQAQVLGAIRDLSQGGVSPTLREIGSALGITNQGNVHRLCHQLRARGLIEFAPRRARSIRVIGQFEDLAKLTDADLLALSRRVREVLRGRGL